MKVIGNSVEILTTLDKHSKMSFTISNWQHQRYIRDLSNDIDYSITITKVKSKRSIQQNKLLWELLHKLEIATRELAIDWYIKALVDTGAVTDYVWGTNETEDILKKSFRAVQKVKPHKIKNAEGWLYRVIVGSSKFNVTEMNELIDTVMRYCNEHNIKEEYNERD